MIQLFDSSLISKNHSASDNDDSANPLPSFFHSGRSDSLFSLGNLLYRVGHRLSLSVVRRHGINLPETLNKNKNISAAYLTVSIFCRCRMIGPSVLGSSENV